MTVQTFFRSLNRKLKRGSYSVQIARLTFISILIPLAFLPVAYLLDNTLGENAKGPDKSQWVLGLIVAPIIETFLNQYLPFVWMQDFSNKRNRFLFYILLSSLIFGLMHWYSIPYVVFAFSAGLVLGYTFYLYHKNRMVAFLSTTLVHALRNGIVYVIYLLNS